MNLNELPDLLALQTALKELIEVTKRSEKAVSARHLAGPGITRAKVTTLNARWIGASEAKARQQDEFIKLIRQIV